MKQEKNCIECNKIFLAEKRYLNRGNAKSS